MIDVARSCWCSADGLREFGPGYLRCSACGTLVGQDGLSDEATRVRDDDVDYYGKRYWLEHQVEDLGLPDIYTRARQDLPERCVHWLETLLRYRRPPAKVLEVGAGHGAYTALLRAAGYDATALDVSPWVAEFAAATFEIPYLVGPVEEQELPPGSFDVIVANDVLEHLPEPFATMRRCAALLRRGGVLVVQTPEYPSGREYEELLASGDLFLEHMGSPAQEHLYLFSRPALEQLLQGVGLPEISFAEPVYAYDMFCVASASPLQESSDDPEQLLGPGAAQRLVLAMIDAHDALRASDAESAARLDVIERLDAALKESEADRQARLEAIETLDAALKKSEADRQALLPAFEEFCDALRRAKPVVTRRWVARHLETILQPGEAVEDDRPR
jgi:2-polyprenyl-3-methyl-5-hydroxy-6-metoxy-1,4-benzoquinol methylase